MSLPPLLPAALWLILFLVPAVLYAAWRLVSGPTRERRLAAVLTPGVAASMWLAGTHLGGRIFQSYSGGVIAGTALPASVGIALAVRRITARGTKGVAAVGATTAGEQGAYTPWMYVGMAVGTMLLFPAAWKYCFHDEPGATGHLALIYEMQRGIYPPRNLTFPQLEMPYHYGFDVVAAFVSALLRISPLDAIDVVTLTAWAYAWCLFWALGEKMFGRRGGPICAFLCLFGGGLPYYCAATANLTTSLAAHLLTVCYVDDRPLNPTLISYVFQHPWSLGIPLVGLVGLWLASSALDSRRDYVVAFVLLVALDLCQFAAWTATVPILTVVILFGARPRTARHLIEWLAVLGAALVAARFAGGFWSHHGATSFSLQVRPGLATAIMPTLLWDLQTFGPLLLGVLALPWLDRANRPRVYFAQTALGGMLVCNVFAYGKSWDIVKFATFASIGFAVLTTGVVVQWLRSRFVAARIGAVATLLVAGLSAAGFLLVFDAQLSLGSINWIFSCPPGMTGVERQAGDWLRRHMKASDVMYREPNASSALVTYAGIAQAWIGNAAALPIPDDLIANRVKLMETLPPDPGPYQRQGIRFFVLDGISDGKIGQVVRAWQARGIAHERVQFDNLRIVEIDEHEIAP